jgi:hypothetical protein
MMRRVSLSFVAAGARETGEATTRQRRSRRDGGRGEPPMRRPSNNSG